ncbi:hypothetical protein KKB41_03870 [Patescibacteria group bacterium]|nr:hypothetical protein [Patescibacteria group bacterium]
MQQEKVLKPKAVLFILSAIAHFTMLTLSAYCYCFIYQNMVVRVVTTTSIGSMHQLMIAIFATIIGILTVAYFYGAWALLVSILKKTLFRYCK